MPDRHSGLPAHPDLEYYRKQAKHLLRSYEAGDAAARARAAEVLGDRAAGRFLLSDAQFVLAQEHGFRTWAEFRADIQSQRTTGDRPVSRLWSGSSSYASQADSLLTQLRRGDPDALQRLRAQVPRYAAATDASTAELRDARLVIAREAGFPTWRELVEAAEKSQRDEAEREENWRRLRPEAEALLAGDTARLAQLTAGQADILLQMLAGQEILGTRPGQELGAPRAAVDVLIGKATRLDLPLDRAARAGRVEYVRLLLDAGADPRSRTDGITPLESAIYFGRPPMIDLLAGHGIVPQGLWTYAACGRLDLVRACFDADGRLRPDAALSRPNTASFYPIPPRKPVSDDPEQIMAEAFVYACQHGRIEVVRWFLDRGLNPDAAPFFGRTALLWAVMCQQPEVVRLLIERGADPSRREELIPFGAEGMVAVLFATDRHDPVIRQLHELLNPRSAELPPQVPTRRSPSADRTTGTGNLNASVGVSRVTGILSAAQCNKAPFMYEMKGALSGRGPGSASFPASRLRVSQSPGLTVPDRLVSQPHRPRSTGRPASLYRFVRLPGLPGATRRPPVPDTRCKFRFPGLYIAPGGNPLDGARFLR